MDTVDYGFSMVPHIEIATQVAHLAALLSEAETQNGRLEKLVEVLKEEIRTYRIEEIYGYRGRDERIYFLCPWEFIMYWEVWHVR